MVAGLIERDLKLLSYNLFISKPDVMWGRVKPARSRMAPGGRAGACVPSLTDGSSLSSEPHRVVDGVLGSQLSHCTLPGLECLICKMRVKEYHSFLARGVVQTNRHGMCIRLGPVPGTQFT